MNFFNFIAIGNVIPKLFPFVDLSTQNKAFINNTCHTIYFDPDSLIWSYLYLATKINTSLTAKILFENLF